MYADAKEVHWYYVKFPGKHFIYNVFYWEQTVNLNIISLLK